MSGLLVLSVAATILAIVPLVLTVRNLAAYPRPSQTAPPGTALSVLIPARNEAAAIGGALDTVLAARGVVLEVLVGDDNSQDDTAQIVKARAHADPRLRLIAIPPLPPNWSGKQHACWILSQHARYPVLLFMDADVRMMPDGPSRIAAFLLARDIGLASGFPRERAETFGERVFIPLIHFLLLGYLPIALARRSPAPGLAAGCGQLMAVTRVAYDAAGGHTALRESLHDGIKLPRAMRRAGFMTDLFDATDLAECRMYRGWRESWRGFSKNATEGMATPLALPIWTFLLFGGHVLPWLVLIAATLVWNPPAAGVAAFGVFANLYTRVVLAHRFKQSMVGVFLHPITIVALLALQWAALARSFARRPARWRGRAYPATR